MGDIPHDLDLVLERTLAAPRHAIWRCWTEADLLKQFFCPRPWTTPVAELDVRPGGTSFTVMNGPNGEEFENRGVYLEVVPDRRLVFTDAYTEAWLPSDKPFMTAIIDLDDALGGGTLYRAIARHWTAEDKDAHEKMGFHDGWGAVAGQLEALAKTL
ncbi:MAG: SRPBCC family protein [Rhodobiaceae bacterium]|nr:SRPBCC family protein [Rhodobiaceae bacterium]